MNNIDVKHARMAIELQSACNSQALSNTLSKMLLEVEGGTVSKNTYSPAVLIIAQLVNLAGGFINTSLYSKAYNECQDAIDKSTDPALMNTLGPESRRNVKGHTA